MMPRAVGQYVFLREGLRPSVGSCSVWPRPYSGVATRTEQDQPRPSPWSPPPPESDLPGVSRTNFLFDPIRLGSTPAIALIFVDPALSPARCCLAGTVLNMQRVEDRKTIQHTFPFTKTAALIGLIGCGIGFGMNRGSAAVTRRGGRLEQRLDGPVCQKDLGVVGQPRRFVLLLGKGDDRGRVLADA